MSIKRLTLQDELKAIEERFHAEQSAAYIKHEILDTLAHLDDDLEEPHVHVHPIYGSEASVRFKADWPVALKLLRSLPKALPALLVRDFSLSFMLAEYANTPSGTRREGAERTVIFPYWVKIQPAAFSGRADFIWYGKTGDRVVNFHVEVPIHQVRHLFTVTFDRKAIRGETIIENTKLTFDARLREMAECASLQHPIKWERGSSQYPNDFTLYWKQTHLGCEPRETFAAFLEGITPTAKEVRLG